MRLDATDLRYVTHEEFRTEIGSKNHEVVPVGLIAELSGLRGGNVAKLCGSLAKRNLIARVANTRYDGYRLTYGGLDYLALKTFSKRKPPSVTGVGNKIGVGKESDIYLVLGGEPEPEKRVLKLHRLGRISFRAIKSKRDYLGKRSSASWMYMSRLSAEKEFAFMKVLYEHDFPVPTPIDQARHCVVMSLIDSTPLRAVMSVPDPAKLYGELMELIMRFARASLIHGDFNEFNILIRRKTYEPVVIDFPQMVSTHHENAEYFFNRDVNCIRRFFRKRFRFEGTTWPVWSDVLSEWDEHDAAEKAAKDGEGVEGVEGAEAAPAAPAATETIEGASAETTEGTPEGAAADADSDSDDAPQFLRLDLEVEASGFGRQRQRELEDYMIEVQDVPRSDVSDDEELEEEEESDEEDDEVAEEVREAEGAAEVVDAEAEAAAKLEKLRLHRALGNDGDPDEPLPEPEPLFDEEEAEESDSDADSDGSVGVAPSDYTQYVRAPRPPRQRLNVSKLGKVDEVRDAVAGEMARSTRSKTSSGGKGASKVGRAKGHKWKSNATYQIGKNTGWN